MMRAIFNIVVELVLLVGKSAIAYRKQKKAYALDNKWVENLLNRAHLLNKQTNK